MRGIDMNFLDKTIHAVSVAALAAAFVLYAGCATAVDKEEVQQKANPVKEMHAEALQAQEAEKNKLQWYGYEEGLAKARKEGKFVMVDFYADWCKWCKKLDAETYKDPAVVAELREYFVPIKIDSESSKKVVHEMRQMSMSELAEAYGVSSYPTVWFLDKDGKKVRPLNGFLPASDFVNFLKVTRGGAR